VNPGRLKGSDPVAVHPTWLTVHEVHADAKTLRCGNPHDKIPYKSMTRSQAQGMAGTKPCRSLACEAARR
jgi:hypothetical protein